MGENASKLWAIVQREYLERVRTKWFVIGTLFGPVIFSLFVFIPLIMTSHDEASTAHRVILLDATGTHLGRYTATAIGGARGDDTDAMSPDLRPVTPAALPEAERGATRDVAQRLASGYVVLDDATLRGDSLRYGGRRTDSHGDMARLTSAVRTGLTALQLENSGVDPVAVDSAMNVPTPALRTHDINDSGNSDATPAKAILAMFVAFFLYISIILYGQSMLSGVIEEKLSRVAEIVISSVKPDILLAGKVLGVTAVGLTQQIIWVAGSLMILAGRSYFAGPPAPGAATGAATGAGGSMGMGTGDFLAAVLATPWSWVLIVLLFFLLGFIFYGSLYAAVGATVGSEQEARLASQPVMLLLILTAVFISPIVVNPVSKLSVVMSLLPFSSPIIMPLRMAVTDVSAFQVTASLVLLVAGCLGAVWLAARIYRVGLLMYGKRPTLRELRRWIAAS